MSKKKLNNKNSNVTKDAKVYRSRLIGELLSPSGSTAVTYKFDTDNNIRFIKTFPVDKIVNSTNGKLFYFENTVKPNIFYDGMDMDGKGSNKKYYCPSYIQYIKDKDIIYNYIKDDNTRKGGSIPVNSLVIFIKEGDQPCNQNNDNKYQMSSNMLIIPRDLCKITLCQEIRTIRTFEYSLVQGLKNDDLFYEYYSNIKNVVFISDGKIDPVYAPDIF